MKNIEKIKNMNSDEMAKLLNGNKCNMCTYNNTNCFKEFCKVGIEEWLNQEYDLTFDNIEKEYNEFCKGKVCEMCKYTENDCLTNYMVDHFNIIDGKITKRQK